MYNFSDVPAEMSLQFWDIGLSTAAGRGLEMHDCWAHEDIGKFSERYVTTLQPHDCAVYTAKVVKL
jgi:alpha-galactosidase